MTVAGGRRADTRLAATVLVALTAIAPFTVDTFTPSMPAIADEFEASTATMRLAVTLFLASFAGSQLIYGPVSDRIGRRPTLIAGLLVYIVGSILALSAGSAPMLLAGRIVQGLGGGAGPAVSQAIVLDVYGRSRAARVLSYMSIATPLAPAVSPVIGGALHDAWGWRSVFVFLTVLGAVLMALYLSLMPETNRHDRPPRGLGGLGRDYRTVLSSRPFVAYALVMGLMFSGQLIFISTSSFVVIDQFGASARTFGFVFAAQALGIMAGAYLSSRAIRRLPGPRVVLLGASVMALGGAVMTVLAWSGAGNIWVLTGPMVAAGMGSGLSRPSAQAGALVPFPEMAGMAASLLGFTQIAWASAFNIAYSSMVEASFKALATGIFATACAAVAALLVLRPRAT